MGDNSVTSLVLITVLMFLQDVFVFQLIPMIVMILILRLFQLYHRYCLWSKHRTSFICSFGCVMIKFWLAESTIHAQLLGELNAAGMQMDSESGRLFTNLHVLGFVLTCIILELNDIFVPYNLILDTHNHVLNFRLGENIPWEIHQIFQNILSAANAESLQGMYSLLLYF